ncbi:MAG: hypothetical protein JWO79_422 [Actinomycetia bacterium]|jgi:hypothetical protein|nr:hypothetical protein [Actinomycetes bacterium]
MACASAGAMASNASPSLTYRRASRYRRRNRNAPAGSRSAQLDSAVPGAGATLLFSSHLNHIGQSLAKAHWMREPHHSFINQMAVKLV